MSNDSYIFEVPANYHLEDLRPRISSQHTLEYDPPERVARQYLDTFDWRLYNAGQVLEMVREKTGQRLILRSLHQGKPLLSQSAYQIPRFARDCTGPGTRARLQQVIGMRALQPKVPVSGEVQTLRLVNADGKTVLRLELHQDHISLPHSTRQIGLPSRLYLVPYRGYEKVARKVQDELMGRGRLRPSREDPLVYALKAVDTQAGGYSSNPSYAITPQLSPQQALVEVLRVLLGMMQANLDGVCKDLDSEFLHDFREAVLRSGFLLSQVPEAFGDVRLRRYQEEFAWLDRISYPTRQLDVYLLLVDEFRLRLPERLQPYLGPFHEYLRDHKKVEQRELRVALQSPRYAKLARDWGQFLERAASAEASGTLGETSVAGLASRLLWSRYREVLQQGEAITPESPAQALCDLHHSCKHLGFLVEFFGPLYPQKKLATVRALLDSLRKNLSEFEHIEMQQIQLKGFTRDMKEEQRLGPASMEAMDLLILDLDEQEQKLRKTFAKRFAEFEEKKARQRFRALFASQPTTAEEDR